MTKFGFFSKVRAARRMNSRLLGATCQVSACADTTHFRCVHEGGHLAEGSPAAILIAGLRKSKVRLYSGVLFVVALSISPCYAAPAQSSAPSAGGYSSDNGSDFGVGLNRNSNGREPIAVLGLGGKSMRGAVPWIGLRLSELLAQKLAPVMGDAPSTANVAQFLAARGLRAGDFSCPQNAGGAVFSALKKDAIWKKRVGLAVMGDVTLSGIAHGKGALQAASFANENATLTIRLRAIRLADSTFSPVVTIAAPAREWAQIPARTALAILDSLGVSLSEDERTNLVRDASPLSANATSERLRAEQRLGEGIAAALDCRVLSGKSNKENWRAAALRGETALEILRTIGKTRPQIGDKNAAAQIAASAKNWISYAATTTKSARLRAAR